MIQMSFEQDKKSLNSTSSTGYKEPTYHRVPGVTEVKEASQGQRGPNGCFAFILESSPPCSGLRNTLKTLTMRKNLFSSPTVYHKACRFDVVC